MVGIGLDIYMFIPYWAYVPINMQMLPNYDKETLNPLNPKPYTPNPKPPKPQT